MRKYGNDIDPADVYQKNSYLRTILQVFIYSHICSNATAHSQEKVIVVIQGLHLAGVRVNRTEKLSL